MMRWVQLSKVKTVKTPMHAVLKSEGFFLVLQNTKLSEIHDFHNDFTITLGVVTWILNFEVCSFVYQ